MFTQSYDIKNFDDHEKNRLINQGGATWSYEKKFLLNSGLQPNNKVLDIGCGPGIFSILVFNEFLNENGNLVGIDQNISLINNKLPKYKNLHFLNGNAYELSSYYDQFDFVILRLVLQHLNDPLKVLKEAYNTLNKNGRIFILDSDDSLFKIFPEHKNLKRLLSFSQKKQFDLGGDRFIGGKIGNYLYQVGFKEINQDIFLITPPKCGGVDNFLNISLGFRDALANDDEKSEISIMKNDILAFYNSNLIHAQNGSYIWVAKK